MKMSLLSKGLKKAEKWVGSKIPHVSSAEKRAAMQATTEQIDYYKAAKAEIGEQRRANDEQKKTERSRINEKEIRAKQRTYRRGGFMAEPSINAPAETLG